MEHRPDPTKMQWRKSTYSGTNGGDCLEVSDGHPGIVPVRDSKHPAGPILVISTDAWQTFTNGLR